MLFFLHSCLHSLLAVASRQQINSQTKTINTSVQSELNIVANITDNQAIYRCEAVNSATDVPLIDTKTLSVHCKYEVIKHISYICMWLVILPLILIFCLTSSCKLISANDFVQLFIWRPKQKQKLRDF